MNKVVNKFPIDQVRDCFPILKNNSDLVYLDSAASCLKPVCLFEHESRFFNDYYANVHRANYSIAEKMTADFEETRNVVAKWINADKNEIIFTKGTTDSINLVAYSLGDEFIYQGDEIIITDSEHHPNIVPWQILRDKKKAALKIWQVNEFGELNLSDLEGLITEKTKILSLAHISNVLGNINPIKKIVEVAHSKGVFVMVDGAQAIGHIKVDVKDLGVDFYAFSCHKAYGPNGVGILYGKKSILDVMSPYQGGGYMISSVSLDYSSYNQVPAKFEAGTPNITGVASFKSSINFLNSIGMEKIHEWENQLTKHIQKLLVNIDGINFVTNQPEKGGIISFYFDDIHIYDINTLLGEFNIAIRSGFMCAEPVVKRLGSMNGVARVSIGMYNNTEDLESFVLKLKKVLEILRKKKS